MKYGRFKYGSRLYGIFRGATVWIRARVSQVLRFLAQPRPVIRAAVVPLPLVAIRLKEEPAMAIQSYVGRRLFIKVSYGS